MNFLTLDDVQITGKRVLIREDFNVPMADAVIQSDVRIRAALPGIQRALASNAQVRLMSHLGRPEAPDPEFSLQPIAQHLQQLLGVPVKFLTELRDSDAPLVLYENVRFFPGETANSFSLAQQMADLCDIFVMDAFASAHRAHASTVGVCELAPVSVAGPLLVQEVQALDRVLLNPKRPVVTIIGGAKVSSKLQVLEALLRKTDYLLIGGGMANTFLAAKGIDIKQSLVEPELLPLAQDLLKQYQRKIILPSDFVWQDDRIMDLGPNSCAEFAQLIAQAATILWNGPMGVFENTAFANGTRQIANELAKSKAYSVAGGGDTLAAIDKWKLADQFSYISTGGGAFLEYIEGKELPAIKALIGKSKHGITTH